MRRFHELCVAAAKVFIPFPVREMAPKQLWLIVSFLDKPLAQKIVELARKILTSTGKEKNERKNKFARKSSSKAEL